MSSSGVRQIPLGFRVGKYDGKLAEMHAEMAKIARIIKIRDKKLRVQLFTPTGHCLSDYYQADTAS